MSDLSSLSLKMHSASSTIKEKILEGAESYLLHDFLLYAWMKLLSDILQAYFLLSSD